MGRNGPHIIDQRYAIYDEIASGGMATVHFGCSLGAASFSRIVAVKRLHAHLAQEPEFLTMFLDEARVAARIRHPNVAPTLDVVATDHEIFLVMEYVHGESLSKLFSAMRVHREPMPLRVAAAIVCGLLRGLHAAHEATDERGACLRIVHRDVSPHNVIVGADGLARIVDFGIAKATGRLQRTRTGEIKGKFGYMAPEQVNGASVTRATDIYAAGVVLWESLTGATLYTADSDVQLAAQVLLGRVAPPSHVVQGVPAAFDDIVMRALDRDPAARFPTAQDMARAIESSLPVANASEVGAWVHGLVAPALLRREERLAEIERDWANRTGAPDMQRIEAAPSDAQGDTSTRAVSYAAAPEDATRVEGGRRSRHPSSLSDSVDIENDARPSKPRSLGTWAAIAASASIAVAAIAGQHVHVHGWRVRASPSTVVSPEKADGSLHLQTAPRPAAVGAAPPDPIVIPAYNDPVINLPTISVEDLPRAAPTLPHAAGSARPRSAGHRP